jgi:SAM-dependent methyltransferase|tara:strand:+ start:3337 stop:4083 length:747 start_codon:yes stop_codon:yes gene_type:complete
MENYQQKMASRDDSLDSAMQIVPLARQLEFINTLKYADLKDGHVLVDYPSAGGYLSPHIDCHVTIQGVDTVENFLPLGRDGKFPTKRQTDNFATMPFAANSVDRFITIAGLHHIPNLEPFFGEVRRCLKQEGVFVIAEVKEGTAPAYFLNHYVDMYDSCGHDGLFLNESVCEVLEKCGFKNAQMFDELYPWKFDSVKQMINFARGVFSMDLASDEQILFAIDDALGYEETATGVNFNWQLSMFRAERA